MKPSAAWRRALWVLAALVGLSTALFAAVYATTDHPRPQQPAEVNCRPDAPALQPGQDLRVMSWNVQYLAGGDYVFFYDLPSGNGPDTQPSAESTAQTLQQVAALIRRENPDVVLLQEVDRHAKRTGYRDQLADLRAELGQNAQGGELYPCAAAAYYWRAAFVPHPRVMGRVGLSLVTLSKTRITAATRYDLPRICGDPLTVALNFRRAVLGVQLATLGGPDFTAFNTHLDAFAQGCDTMQRQVARVGEVVEEAPGPWVLGGDFNLLASPEARARLPEREAAAYNPQSELAPLLGQYRSFPSAAQTAGGDPRYFTYFSNDPRVSGPDRTIDYLLYSPGLETTNEAVLQNAVTPQGRKLSDHFPLMNTVNWR